MALNKLIPNGETGASARIKINTAFDAIDLNTTKAHEHSNKSVLDTITTGDITNWDNKEDNLGVPSINGQILSSDTTGNRIWIDVPGCDMSSDQCASIKANNTLSSTNYVISKQELDNSTQGVINLIVNHANNDNVHLTSDQNDALDGANSPSSSNPLATMADIPSSSGDMLKSVYDTNDNGIVDNAEKVNNHTVETDVPAGAVFTDTIYDDTALSNRVSTNETNIANLDTRVSQNETDITNLESVVNGKQDDLGLGNPGQVLATDTAGTGTEWIDVSGGSAGCDMTADQCAGIKANTDLSSTNKVVDEDQLLRHENNMISHMTEDQNEAFDNANSPSATNPLATMADIPSSAGDMLKSVYDTNDNGIVDNAEKVNGLTVETAVPAGAVFTDTVYDDTALSNRVSTNETNISNLDTRVSQNETDIGNLQTAAGNYVLVDGSRTMTGDLVIEKNNPALVLIDRNTTSPGSHLLIYTDVGSGDVLNSLIGLDDEKVLLIQKSDSTGNGPITTLKMDESEPGLVKVIDEFNSSIALPTLDEHLSNKKYVDQEVSTKQDNLGFGTAGQVLATNTSANGLEWIDANESLTEVYNEIPTLQIGANTIQLTNPAKAETLRVYKNGLRQANSIDYTYNETAKLISFLNGNFTATDTVVLDYKY